MSDQSANLQLSFVAAAQAQKHVTINESLLRLDALVQLSAVSASISAQPASPADGALYILPAGKTGAQWSAMANGALAYHRDGAWEQIIPREGFTAYVKDADVTLCHDGAAWTGDKRVSGGIFLNNGQAVFGKDLAGAVRSLILLHTDDTVLVGPNSHPVILRGSALRANTHLTPVFDNALTCGSAALRWSTLYAASGTINTSDAREKTALEPLPAGVKRAMRRVVAGVGVFQWLASVAAKGADGARLHVGVTAQAVREAFAAEGLDAGRWGLFCADEVEGQERLGVRADQLMWLALAVLFETAP